MSDFSGRLRELRAFSEAHHGDQDPAMLLHALLVDIPARLDDIIAALDAQPVGLDAADRLRLERDQQERFKWAANKRRDAAVEGINAALYELGASNEIAPAPIANRLIDILSDALRAALASEPQP